MKTTPCITWNLSPASPPSLASAISARECSCTPARSAIGNQLRLRVTAPGIPSLETIGVTLLFFGDPETHFGEGESSSPFLTNPVDCSAGPLSATAEVDTWEHPGFYHIAESTTYPQLTGCNMLQFAPTLSVKPEKTQADEPSGYEFAVQSNQNETSPPPAPPS